ncbi:IclR family transcriptional regulator [Acuticoccus kandeliae]|uniref:IclR family transcriptional regulator n=1 Tax=Acuticoccus kandeliae TaxID=2073160 RepID=UPI000D3E5D5B|nr:IclR family transcriptional regulator [Acuticoccus kandeliae]
MKVETVAPAKPADGIGAQSVDRALRLLSLIGRHCDHGVALGAIVDESRLNKPTARRLLMALMRAGLVEQDVASRRYFLGEGAYVLGTLASRRYNLLEVAMESLKRLAELTADTAFVSARRENYAVCLHREEGAYPVRTHALMAGYQHPLGVGAGSLAMLASMSDEEIDRVLADTAEIRAEAYPNHTDARLRADIAITREQGHSLNPGLIVPSSWGIGATITFPDGRVAGALSIAAIDSRMTPERQRDIAALLTTETRKVERKLARMFTAGQERGAKSQTPAPAQTME